MTYVVLPTYFEGFSWAIPRAFSDALNSCLFEEGDLLYDTAGAYESNVHKTAIQVRYPERMTGGRNSEAGVFESNWGTTVKVEVYEEGVPTSEKLIQSTQGQLYTALWKGSLSYLTDETVPPVPKRIKDLTRSVEAATEKARRIGRGNPVFAMPYDAVNPVSRQKLDGMSSAFHEDEQVAVQFLSLQEAEVPNWVEFAPTLQVALFITKKLSANQLTDRVKQVLYKPSSNAKNPQFRISAHGIIV